MDVSQLVLPLAISAVIAFGGQYVKSSADSETLKEYVSATRELSAAVTKLDIKLSIFGERYVTRKELDEKLKESKNGS